MAGGMGGSHKLVDNRHFEGSVFVCSLCLRPQSTLHPVGSRGVPKVPTVQCQRVSLCKPSCLDDLSVLGIDHWDCSLTSSWYSYAPLEAGSYLNAGAVVYLSCPPRLATIPAIQVQSTCEVRSVDQGAEVRGQGLVSTSFPFPDWVSWRQVTFLNVVKTGYTGSVIPKQQKTVQKDLADLSVPTNVGLLFEQSKRQNQEQCDTIFIDKQNCC